MPSIMLHQILASTGPAASRFSHTSAQHVVFSNNFSKYWPRARRRTTPSMHRFNLPSARHAPMAQLRASAPSVWFRGPNRGRPKESTLLGLLNLVTRSWMRWLTISIGSDGPNLMCPCKPRTPFWASAGLIPGWKCPFCAKCARPERWLSAPASHTRAI